MGGIEGSNPNAKFLVFILIAIFNLACISPSLIVIIDSIHYYKNDNLFNQINFYNNIIISLLMIIVFYKLDDENKFKRYRLYLLFISISYSMIIDLYNFSCSYNGFMKNIIFFFELLRINDELQKKKNKHKRKK